MRSKFKLAENMIDKYLEANGEDPDKHEGDEPADKHEGDDDPEKDEDDDEPKQESRRFRRNRR